jgi:adenylate cyclase class 2
LLYGHIIVAIEIEAKIKVDSLEPIAERLKEAGGKFEGELSQRDTYFNDTKGSLTKSGSGLRLRREVSDDGEKTVMTFKGPKKKGPFKSRQEIEVGLGEDGFSGMVDLLGGIGFEQVLVFEKKRNLWLLDGCQVCLDEVPLLGNFVEVEGPDEHVIAEVLSKIQLYGLEHINKGYAKLMREKLDEIGSDKTEIFFGSEAV